ncbi:hypothetical protein [Microbacterium sp.]|uniref:hypothetical protein n=1 Tax=Microbacterium sp. TaxID=51671 RepID=UPI0028114ED0|nr:hypothetical protein [Microbacterium sp.]
MLKRLRRRMDEAVERRVDARVAVKLEQVLAELEKSQRDYEARLGGTQADFSFIRSEFDRIAPQLAALEQRFEALRAQIDLTDVDPAHALVLARAEHERARLRLEIASHYEERLRRLEDEPRV